MTDKELDDFVSESIKQKELETKTRIEAETKEVSNIAQDPVKTVKTKLNMAVASFVETSPEVKEQIVQSGQKLVKKGLEIQENDLNSDLNRSKKDKNKSEFELNEDNYRAFGYDTAPEKVWKKKFIEVGNDFWFVFMFIICFFTLAPFYSFTKIIKTQSGILKFVAIATGVVMLLTILGGVTFAILKRCGVC